MILVKVGLIFLLIIAFLVFSFSRKLGVLRRLFMIVFLLVSVVCIIFPELTNRVAHFFSIGRGVDLLMYFAIGFLGFISAVYYAKHEQTDVAITKIVRTLALKEISKNKAMPAEDGK